MKLLVCLMNSVPGVSRLLSWASRRSQCPSLSGGGCPFVRNPSHTTVAIPGACAPAAHAHRGGQDCRGRACCCSPLAVVILALLAVSAAFAVGLAVAALAAAVHSAHFAVAYSRL
jgi:hypothetical protein